MAKSMVRIRNPKVKNGEATSLTTQEAFDKVWKAKGWEIVPAETSETSTPKAKDQADPKKEQ